MYKLPSNKPQHKHFIAKQQLKDQLAQLDTQLEEDAMQKDDLEIDLHALAMKLETILPDYKTLQFQVEELTEQLEEQQQVLQQQQQEREILRRNSTQTTQQIELLEKIFRSCRANINKLQRKWNRRKVC